MKRRIAITSVMLLSSAVFFVVVCAAAGPVEKPVHGMWSGTIYDLGPCADPTFPVPEEAITPPVQSINIGTGVFTHTGRSSFISSFCSYFTSETSAVGSGWTILTASNGDVLHLTIQVSVDLTDFLSNGGPVRWTEHETIVGGTGRFEGADGESFTEGIWTFDTSPFPFGQEVTPNLIQPPQGWEGTTYDGWIRY